MSGQAAISDHGIIGDLRSCALVATDGTIDWFCPQRFDGPSVFGRLLDEDAGHWGIEIVGGHSRTHQFYLPDSAVLVTRFMCPAGVAEVHDFFPLLQAHDPDHRQRLVRRIRSVRGEVTIRTVLQARPDYGRERPSPQRTDAGVLLVDGDVRLGITATHDLEVVDGGVAAEVTLDHGQEARFTLHVLEAGDDLPEESDLEHAFEETTRFWRSWLDRSLYRGRWREMVQRSAITLKLLTHEPTGAVVAAPTTSLPEEVGGERNWDYRYVWVRDAAFTIYALLRLGFTDEAASFMRWLSERMGDDTTSEGGSDGSGLGPLRNLYDLDGNVPGTEHELDHLRGHADSRPVRVGNAAAEQLQLDIYGEVIDSVYLYNKYGPGISVDAWRDMTRIVDWVAEHWEREDAGMWEIRDDPRPHTTSRLMCWVAIERMIRMARQRGLPGDLSAWGRVRDAIQRHVVEDCWNDELGSFVQHAGGDTVDAGLLLMPLVKFLAPNDPRFLSTLEALEDRLVADSLVFRYDLGRAPDGLDGVEGTFSICSFWYVEALTRAGRLEDARLALEKMFTYANHLGLYAEQVGLTGDQLGNFPQAFTHLSLISAAINLDRALG
ncbi:glycoside hydrolase family 15 protein [Nocardioides coralli]|uniref:glycoside hydrolase family 15 protein n=1 Tax=Nocardioides coralli TaxID=2872154 RepID=UPI001CA44E88|nr:glycoside hydrolase family 15 protein [Nocardioides coralli]QZY29843.1 glycoside hydrolase family 15 protein [Nocardioides coralli]